MTERCAKRPSPPSADLALAGVSPQPMQALSRLKRRASGRGAAFGGVAMLLGLINTSPAYTQSQPASSKDGAVAIALARIPTPPNGAKTAAGYFRATNKAHKSDRLMTAFSPAADKVEIHSMSMTGGVMRMRPVADGVAMGPGAAVQFAPNGLHLMFIGLHHGLKTGDAVPVTLTFARSGTVAAIFHVTNAEPPHAETPGKMSAMNGPMRP